MITRPLGKQDYDHIVQIIDRWWGGPTTALAHPIFFYELGAMARVVEHDGILVGFLLGFVAPGPPKTGYVHLVGIHPDYRRRGVGKVLYQTFEEDSRAAGCTRSEGDHHDWQRGLDRLSSRHWLERFEHRGLRGPRSTASRFPQEPVIAQSATVTAARQGREVLATALLSLQTAGISEPVIAAAVEHTASASSALYCAEASSPTEEASASYIHQATDSLQNAMSVVGSLRQRYPQLEVAATSIARALALLYPVLQHSLRQRRARLQLSDSDARELRTMASFPRAPAPTGRFRRPSSFGGGERRTQGDKRVFIEIEIGLSTESHIYTGLSLDVSTGGVFVATYEPAEPGTSVTLYFVLPDGYVVNAEGVVRWTRAGTNDTPPGMGVAFVKISQDALAHIAGFCASRAPLYFDE